MDIIQIILLALLTFVLAIDQFSLTETIQRPIISCTLMGLILGDLNTGLAVGGTYELMMIGNMPVGGAQPPNHILGGVVAMVLAVKSGLTVEAALGASVVFAVLGQYAITLTFTLMSMFMAKADKAALDADVKGITNVNIISCCILGSLFALAAVIAYVGGQSLAGPLEAFQSDFKWFMDGLGAAGGMMRYVGFGILMKIMLSNDMWGIYFAGFAAAAILGNIDATKGATLILVAFIGIAIALNDYQSNIKIKENAGQGGMSDGI